MTSSDDEIDRAFAQAGAEFENAVHASVDSALAAGLIQGLTELRHVTRNAVVRVLASCTNVDDLLMFQILHW